MFVTTEGMLSWQPISPRLFLSSDPAQSVLDVWRRDRVALGHDRVQLPDQSDGKRSRRIEVSGNQISPSMNLKFALPCTLKYQMEEECSVSVEIESPSGNTEARTHKQCLLASFSCCSPVCLERPFPLPLFSEESGRF